MVTKIINGITSTINISESTESLDDLPIFAGTVKSLDDRLLSIVGNDDVDITLVDVESLLGSSIFYIGQESDFPVQDNDTITLTTGCYLITAPIILTKRFVFDTDASVEIAATCQPINFLLYPLDGTLFSGTPRFIFIRDIIILGSTGIGVFESEATLFDISNTPPARTAFFLDNVSISIFKDYGTLSGLTTVIVSVANLAVFEAGLKMIGITEANFEQLRITNSNDFISQSSNDSALKLLSGDFELFVCRGSSFRPLTDESFFFIDPSANVTSGVLADNAFDDDRGGTFYGVGSIDETDPSWRVSGNGIQKDSAVVGEFVFNNNATETVISTIDTPVIIAGTGVAGNLERITYASNRLTYIGREAITPIIRAFASTIVTANNEGDSYTMTIYKNGSPITDITNTKAMTGIGSSIEFSIQLLDSLVTDDYLEIFIENNTTTENIVLNTAQLIIG